MKFVVSLAAAALLAVPASAVELVVNGGFESPVTSNGGFAQFAGGSSFAGWSVLGNDVIIINTNYNEQGLGFNANSGSNSIDLTGSGNTGPTNGVTQTIGTNLGNYTLRFFVGNASPTGGNGNNYTQPSTVNLSINGGAIQSFTNATDTPNAVNWKQFSVSFITETPTTITFTNGTVGDNMLGLDDVSVTAAVPEPSVWGMMILGFGLVGFAARRRATAVTA